MSRHGVRRRILGRNLRGCLALEISLGSEFAISHLASVGGGDRTVRDLQRARLNTELLRREIDQDRAHLSASKPQRETGVLDRLAARRHAFVRRLAGVARDHLELGDRQIEFFGGDLRERGQDALPEFDLAGEHGRCVVWIDAEPRIQEAVAVEAARQRRRGALGQRVLNGGRVERDEALWLFGLEDTADLKADASVGVLAPDFALDATLGQLARLRGAAPEASGLTASLADRAKAYLHANCATCHVEAGGGNSAITLRWNTKPDIDVSGAPFK